MSSGHLPETPGRSSLLTRWAVVSLTTAVLVALCELGFLARVALEKEGASGIFALGPLLVGNWLPYTALGAFLLSASEWGTDWLAAKNQRPRWLAVAWAVLILPYAGWLAHYTMSGARVAAHPLRHVGMLTLAVLMVAGFSAVMTLAGRLKQQARPLPVIAWLGCGVSWGALWLSGSYLPNEYEPLHAALGYFAVLSGVIGTGALHLEQRIPRASKVAPALSIAIVVTSLAAGWSLVTSNRWAWFVYGETPGSRYVTARFGWEADNEGNSEGSIEARTVAKPDGHLKARRARPAPHIFVFSVDNMQPSHVGAYGYKKRPTTPNIDRLAREGTLFRRAYSYQPQTRIFLTSLLLGRRVADFLAHEFPAPVQEASVLRLLKTRDYFTLVGGVFEGVQFQKFDPKAYKIDTNLRRETPEEIRDAKRIPHIPYTETFSLVEKHLEKASDRPVFVWVHLLGPHWFHGSFSPSDDFNFGDSAEAKFDSAIAGSDQWLARLEQMVQKHLKDERDTYWIVMSDHGAGIPHGEEHLRERGKTVLERDVHVPLIVVGPDVKVGTVDVPVDAALDTAATILEFAGISPPPAYEGISLLSLLEGSALPAQFSERIIPLRNRAWTGAVHGKWKYINYKNVDRLFDLTQDPTETTNLADEHADMVSRLRASSKKQLGATEEELGTMSSELGFVGEE